MVTSAGRNNEHNKYQNDTHNFEKAPKRVDVINEMLFVFVANVRTCVHNKQTHTRTLNRTTISGKEYRRDETKINGRTTTGTGYGGEAEEKKKAADRNKNG